MKKKTDLEKTDKRRIYFHMTRKDYDRIHRNAAKSGMKLGEFFRDKAMNSPIKPILPPETMEIMHKLAAMYPGIHQLVERSKTEDIYKIAEEFEPFREEIDKIHKQILEIAGSRKE